LSINIYLRSKLAVIYKLFDAIIYFLIMLYRENQTYAGSTIRSQCYCDVAMDESIARNAFFSDLSQLRNTTTSDYGFSIGRVQQTQLLRSGSVSARCYWCILLDHPIAANAHESAPQQLSLLNATIIYINQFLS